MLIAVEHLLIKLRQPATRARELIELRQRLRAERAADATADEQTLAAAVLAQKQRVSSRLQAVRSCSSCATGQPWPRGHYDGGDCCSGASRPE